jgi:hypothetical protein
MAADRMNYLHVGNNDPTQWLIDRAKPPFLLIADPSTADAFKEHFRRVRVFDPHKHSFNILSDIDYLKACDFVETLRYIFPAGETTLTREEADHLILEALLDGPRRLANLIPDSDDPAQRKARRLIERLRLSPVLGRALSGKQFDFSGSVVVKLDRATLGNFDALALALFLIGQYKGQVLIKDFVFYGRPLHSLLIQQGRLTCSVRRLDALDDALQQELLLIENKDASGTTYDDAVVLADYMCRFRPTEDGYNTFIEQAMKG